MRRIGEPMKAGIRCIDCGMLIGKHTGPRCALCRARFNAAKPKVKRTRKRKPKC
jgi:hypothetical protein